MNITMVPSDRQICVNGQWLTVDYSMNDKFVVVRVDGSKGHAETMVGLNPGIRYENGECYLLHKNPMGGEIAEERFDEFESAMEKFNAAKEEADKKEAEHRAYLETTEYKNKAAKAMRSKAFALEADPLYFQVQRGEATQAEYDALIADIRARFPYKE